MDELVFQLLEDKTPLDRVQILGVELKPGDRIRLRPRSGGDIMDLALDGKSATIESIEQDYENNIHLAVVVDDDPGKDMGMLTTARPPILLLTERGGAIGGRS